MSKRRKKKGLLAAQKPKRRWSLFARFWKISLLGFLLSLSLGWTYIWLQKHPAQRLSSHERPQLVADKDLSPDDQVRIRDAYRHLSEVTPETLAPLALELHQSMGLRSINVIQTKPFQIHVATEPFVAAMVVELDMWRFVTDDGIVFGQTTEREVQTLPVLKGLDRKAPLVRSPNGTIVPSSGNQRIIDDTLLAISEGKRYNIEYRTLLYDDFRGLAGELQEPAYKVTLGFTPYSNKYLKLEKILTSLKQRGLTSATIELDYKGKAFVKETVL